MPEALAGGQSVVWTDPRRDPQLLPQDAGTTLAFRARLFGVLSQLSLLLEQVGTTPSHRLGTAAVYGRHLQVYIRRRVIDLCVNHHQYETGQLHGDGSDHTAASSGSQAPLMREAEASINQLFSSDWISPTDQAQANMTLDGEPQVTTRPALYLS